MNVEQALTIADTLDASEPNQHRALGKLAAEVRRLRGAVATLTDQRDEARQLATQLSNEGGAEIARLREREAKALELAERTVSYNASAESLSERGCVLHSLASQWSRWLETE